MNIDWPNINPIVSEKDQKAKTFNEFFNIQNDTSFMRIIILGSNGQVGKSLRRILLDEEDAIFLTKQECDLESVSDIQNIFDIYRPELIINCAAYTNVDAAESDVKICNLINNDAVRNIAILSEKNKTF